MDPTNQDQKTVMSNDDDLSSVAGGVGGPAPLVGGPGSLPPAYLRDPKLIEAGKSRANGNLNDVEYNKIRNDVMDQYKNV